MSRIGKKPIPIPDGVKVSLDGSAIAVTGPQGELNRVLHQDMIVKIDDGVINIERPSDRRLHRSLHGLTRSLVANMVEGVHVGYSKKMDIIGVGYRASMKGKSLHLLLGFSHPILVVPPPGITIEVPEQTSIIVKGPSKEMVGEIAAKIRSYRPPEPYKGKGIRYHGEYVRRKAGKAAV